MKSFLETRGWEKLQVALDDDTVASRRYGVSGIPHTVVIDKEGIVQNVHVGASPKLKEILTDEIKETLVD